MVNTVATLLIPKYCIFIFTPRHVISHVISSSIGDVPDKNFATPFFFFFCMTYTKRMPLKSQTHLHWPLVVLFPLLGMFSPSICLSISLIFPSLVNSYPSFKNPVQIPLSPAFSGRIYYSLQYPTIG